MSKRTRESGTPTSRRSGRAGEKYEVGQKLRDRQAERLGTILDFACQYAHPKADPIYSYLVRWDDGQVQALSEAAFEGPYGVEPVG